MCGRQQCQDGEYIFGQCTGQAAEDTTMCVQCKDCARDSPNQYNSVYKYCNGTDREDVVVCALNSPSNAMVGDTCPEGHFVVGKLTAIDGPLRTKILGTNKPSSAMRFLGIVPFVHELYPSVRTGSSVMYSVEDVSSGTKYARIVDFAVSDPFFPELSPIVCMLTHTQSQASPGYSQSLAV